MPRRLISLISFYSQLADRRHTPIGSQVATITSTVKGQRFLAYQRTSCLRGASPPEAAHRQKCRDRETRPMLSPQWPSDRERVRTTQSAAGGFLAIFGDAAAISVVPSGGEPAPNSRLTAGEQHSCIDHVSSRRCGTRRSCGHWRATSGT